MSGVNIKDVAEHTAIVYAMQATSQAASMFSLAMSQTALQISQRLAECKTMEEVLSLQSDLAKMASITINSLQKEKTDA